MNTPAGWHPDPMGRHQFRYWDGLAWTDSVADDGQQSEDPLSQAPQQWVAPQYSGTCEKCQAQTSSGSRYTFFGGRKGATRAQLSELRTPCALVERSFVLLCPKCRRGTPKAAIKRKLASNGRGSTDYWEPYEFEGSFVAQLVQNGGYVRIRDIMQDDWALDETACDATLVFVWEGKPPLTVGERFLQQVAVDDHVDGYGSVTEGWSTGTRVPSGVHKVAVKGGAGSCEGTLAAESGAEYRVDLLVVPGGWSPRIELGTKRTN